MTGDLDSRGLRRIATSKRARTQTPENRAALLASGEYRTGTERRAARLATLSLQEADSENVLLRALRDPPGRYSNTTFLHADRGQYTPLQRPDHDPDQTGAKIPPLSFASDATMASHGRTPRHRTPTDPETGLPRRVSSGRRTSAQDFDMLDHNTAVDSGGFDQYNEQRIYTGDRLRAHTAGGRERAEHRARSDASVRHHERDGAQRPRERDDLADQHRGFLGVVVKCQPDL